MNGIPGEGAFVLMSLPGANLVPHNFYLHSSIVQVLFRLVFNFPLCIYNEMSESFGNCKEHMLNVSVDIFAPHVLCVHKGETCLLQYGSSLHGQLPCCWTAGGLLTLINLMFKLTSTLSNADL